MTWCMCTLVGRMQWKWQPLPRSAVIIFPTFLLSCTFFLLNATSNSNKVEILQQKVHAPKAAERRTILFWNSYWHWRHFQMGVGNRGFKGCNKWRNCYTTTLRSKLFDPNVLIDAVLFHGVGLDLAEVKALKRRRHEIPKLNQGVEPAFILFMFESPLGANLSSPILNDFFNLTFTYRRSADIYRPYGSVVKADDGHLNRLTSLKERSRDIAWIVSHCQTENHREDLVKAMLEANSTLKIDSYGKCADEPVTELPDGEEAYKEIAKNYKFYLAFENSLCLEYVTEKFFNALKYGLIPVVLGGLTRLDYEQIAPPNSFIYAEDFNSTSELMKELELIASKPDLFDAYLSWHTEYMVKTTELEQGTKCQLCDIINEGFQFQNSYSNFKNYWHQNTCRNQDSIIK